MSLDQPQGVVLLTVRLAHTALSGALRCAELGSARSTCQAYDWKSGFPHPHRLVCGKPLTEDTMDIVDVESEVARVAEEAALSAAGIPPPDPSYTRSPALLHQLRLLTFHPEFHYWVCLRTA